MRETVLNALGILLGALAGAWSPWAPRPDLQRQLRLLLTALTVLTGGLVLWTALPSRPWPSVQLLVIGFLALSFGSILGHGMRLQWGLGRLLAWAGSGRTPPESGFAFESVVFAANPLGLAGALLLGATGDWRPLALKAVLDGLAAFGFARGGSRTTLLAAFPVWTVQSILAAAAGNVAHSFADPRPGAALAIACGLITLCAAPVVLGVRRVPLANYLPSLLLAPLMAILWR